MGVAARVQSREFFFLPLLFFFLFFLFFDRLGHNIRQLGIQEIDFTHTHTQEIDLNWYCAI